MSVNDPYVLRKIRYFNAYNKDTNNLNIQNLILILINIEVNLN